MAEVYQPREDSLLLESAVKRFAFGSVLDVGTGSGVQAIAAARKPEVFGVVAVDVNPEALKLAETNAANAGVRKKIVFKKSDLFSGLASEKFDCIAFNPPYLPVSEEENVGDVALESGKSGRELTDRFLAEVEKHLNSGGVVLLLQSSASNWKKTKSALEKKGFRVEVVGEQRFFFEQIVVLMAKRK